MSITSNSSTRWSNLLEVAGVNNNASTRWSFLIKPEGIDNNPSTRWSFLIGGDEGLPTYNPSILTASSHHRSGLNAHNLIFGGKIGEHSEYALFKKSTEYTFAMWRSQLFTIGKGFNITAIKLQLTHSVTTGNEIVPVLVFDNGSRSKNGIKINPTNYPNGERLIIQSPDVYDYQVHGTKNFYLELRFTGSALIGVKLPIVIELETEAEV